MPVATVDLMKTVHKDLKSCPGGYVELRPLSYGQILERRGMTAGMKVRASRGKEMEGEIQTANERVTLYEYQHCVVDHNLTNADEDKLDLKSPLGIKSLDPKVGQEIEGIISDLNNFEEDEDLGNSESALPES